MARTLYLFKKIHPNRGNNTHYFASGTALLSALMATSDYVGSFAENSYRIEADHVKLQAQVSNYNAITYIIDADAESGYFKAFHVRNNHVLSGYVDFAIDLDLWGSNIWLADFSRIHISRTNRHLTGGWYDEIPLANIDANNYYEPAIYPSDKLGKQFTCTNFAAFFVADCVIAQTSVTGEDAITTRKVFAVPLDKFFDMANDETNHAGKGYKPIEIAAEIISGVYKFDETGWQDFPVSVRNIFIAPYNLENRLKPKFVSFSLFGQQNFTAYVVDSYIFPYTYYIGATDIQYDYFLGAGWNVKPLRRFVDLTDSLIQFIFNISPDGLKVVLRQGNHDDDVTDAFMLPITANAKVSSTLERIAKALDYGLQAYGNFAKAFDVTKPEEVLGAASGAVTGALGQISKYFGNGSASPASIATNGDASSTFGWNIPNSTAITDLVTQVTNPFTIFKFKSVRNEAEHARIMGANYNRYVDSFSHLASFPLLGTGTITDTYAVVDSVEMDGVQEDAEDFIRSELARGIYYQVL